MIPSSRVLYLLLGCLVADEIQANCGLAYCPAPSGSESGSLWAGNLDTRFSNFELAGEKGSYLEFIPAVSYTRRNFHSMLHAPFVSLFGNKSAQGFGNPMLLAEYRMAWGASALAVGTQVELPLGNHDDGLAGDHLMALPYATYRWNLSTKIFLAGTSGLSTVVGGHHDEVDSTILPVPVFVNPHGDREFQYRALAGLKSPSHPGISLLEAYWQGQIGLSHEEEGTHYGQAGLRARWPFSAGIAINGFSEFHPTSPQRYTWRMGLGFEILPKKWKSGHSGMETL